MDVSTRSVVSAGIAAGVAVAGFVGPLALAVCSVAMVMVVAAGWPRLVDIPDPGGARVIIGLAGVGAVGVVYATDAAPGLWYLPVVLAMAIVLSFVAELMRRNGRERLVESLSGSVAGVVVGVSCAGWIAADRTATGEVLVVVSATAIAVASAIAAVPFKRWVAVLATVIAAVVAAGSVAYLMVDLEVLVGVLAGVIAGLAVATLHALFDRLPQVQGIFTSLAAAVLPVALGGTLIFVVGRLMAG